jgi:hypothetical protein
VVDTTPLAFSISSSYSPTDKYELLTGPQLTSEGASNETLRVSRRRCGPWPGPLNDA